MKRIWVIEAPGKKESFQIALKEAGFGSDQVLATFGRLFDLPKDSLGFDELMISEPDKASEIIWDPKRKEQVHKLVELLSKGSEILIASDSDLEGELIASQVEGLCHLAEKKSGKTISVFRTSIHAINASGIKSGYANKSSINQNKVRAAKARRVLDRILGYRLHSSDDPWRLSTGRIVTPLVSSLYSDPAEAVVIRKKLPDGWNAIVRLDASKAPQASAVVSMLHGLQPPPLIETSRSTHSFEHKPLTGPEAIRLCMRSLSAEPVEIQQSIQRNYEKGRLSYPRTDSRTLDEVGLKWISRMASAESIEFDELTARERQSERLYRSYDAHDAILPVDDHMPNSSVPLRYLSLDEAVLRVIGDYSMRIGERAEEFTRIVGTIDRGTHSGSRWESSLSKWSDSLTFVKDVDGSGFTQDPLRHELSRAPNVSQTNVSMWKHHCSQMVMERLIDLGLGRPSTLLGLSEKAFTTYLDKNGHVNGRGHIMLEKIMRRLPELLSHESAQEIEKVVCDVQNQSSIGSRLSRAWEILKRNPILLGGGDPVTISSGNVSDKRLTSSPENGKPGQYSENVFELY